MAKKEFNAENVDRVRSGPGVYKLYKKRAKKPTYIGSANNLGRRLGEHAGQKFSKFEVLHTETTREANSCGNIFGVFAYGRFPAGIYTVNPIASSSSWQYISYSASGTRQPITGDAPNYPASVGYAQMSYGPYTNRITAQWARVRNAPPNGVMPTATDPNLSIK